MDLFWTSPVSQPNIATDFYFFCWILNFNFPWYFLRKENLQCNSLAVPVEENYGGIVPIHWNASDLIPFRSNFFSHFGDNLGSLDEIRQDLN